jgi:hypothetical protein
MIMYSVCVCVHKLYSDIHIVMFWVRNHKVSWVETNISEEKVIHIFRTEHISNTMYKVHNITHTYVREGHSFYH